MHNVPIRTDLPLHDLTGGNYWMASAIEYLNDKGKLRLGGNMTDRQIQAMKDGALRAEEQLKLAASLVVDSNTVKIVNHTGHKLISGYPEGRRMWLHIEWFDGQGRSIREDGSYGELDVSVDGNPLTVHSIFDLSAANTRVYEAHMGMTQEWASQLVAINISPELPLKYDRLDGSVEYTLGDLAAMPAGTSLPTFHFVLNNTVISDNRIPPYGMNAEEAKRRNAAPVFEDIDEGYIVDDNGNYPYYDLVKLNPPIGAVSADFELLYQPTSWEYIQFLKLANDGSSDFLGSEGDNMLEAWLNTGMAEPFVMTSAKWNETERDCAADPGLLEGNDDCESLNEAGVSALETGRWVKKRWSKKAKSVFQKTTEFSVGDTVVIRLQVLGSDGEVAPNAVVHLQVAGPETYDLDSIESDENGYAKASWQTKKPNWMNNGGTLQGVYTIRATGLSSSDFEWDGVSAEVNIRVTDKYSHLE